MTTHPSLFRLGTLLPALLLVSALRAQEEPAAPPAKEANSFAKADPASLSAIAENLSPENRKKFGEMLGTDWKDRPEWAEMMIALLKGEPMRPGVGWLKPSEKKYDFTWLADLLDSDVDGQISKDEMPKDLAGAEQLFARLDRDNDGEVRLADFDYAARQQPTPPQMMSQFLFYQLDADSNGRVSPEELTDFFKGADKDKTDFLTVDDLYREFSNTFNNPSGAGDAMPPPDKMLTMFFRGELGVFESGPNIGDVAPDFTLPTQDGKQKITLSQNRGQRPTLLIFGNFTCGPFRSQSGILDKLYARYKDQVDVYAVYVREAHPSDGWKMESNEAVGIKIDQPKTQEARNLVASKCAQSLKLTMPLLVDTINDEVNRAYCGFPERLYLIDRDGKVVYKGGRGPYGFKPRELEQTLIMLLLDEATKKPVAK